MNELELIRDNFELVEGDIVRVGENPLTSYTITPAVTDGLIEYLQTDITESGLSYAMEGEVETLFNAQRAQDAGYDFVDMDSGKPLTESELHAVYCDIVELLKD